MNGGYKTSAKTGENVKNAIGHLVKEIIREGSYISRHEEASKSILGNHTMYRSSLYLTSKQLETDMMLPSKNSIKLIKRYNQSVASDKACCSKNKCY